MNMLLLAAAVGVTASLVPTNATSESAKYVCDFPIYHGLDEFEMQPSNGFVLAFTYDTVTGDAFLEGNNGVSPVFLISGTEGLTFLERLSTGAVQSTTIASNGSAVHSRHSIIWGDLVPSQYYGECK